MGYSGLLRSPADKLMKIMRDYAEKNDLQGMYQGYLSALRDPTGIKSRQNIKGMQ